ncbi:MAG: hypothetical protein C7B47_11265 [Sulfobacillus thermosulfidooxidans]|uniref:Uncharacterized protein n=1 Tax=Sulfobacillus thermosulfidooxidans TaxID=28034 RepID=A0A2T2WU69_SULTH|nr:MAG: hypothetical protein C7B47_11265 [Sulfobacillus thermosulfidooxidans]
MTRKSDEWEEKIRMALHQHLDAMPIPEFHAVKAPKSRPFWASWSLTVGSVAVAGAFVLSVWAPWSHHASPPSTQLQGAAKILNFAIPFLKGHRQPVIPVPSFLPFNETLSATGMIPVVRAGVSHLPVLDSMPKDTHTRVNYWIGVSEKAARPEVASKVTSANFSYFAKQSPWLMVTASQYPLWPHPHIVHQFGQTFWLWPDLGPDKAVAWPHNHKIYTILVSQMSVSNQELLWMAHSMSQNRLSQAEPFTLQANIVMKTAHSLSVKDIKVVEVPVKDHQQLTYATKVQSHISPLPRKLPSNEQLIISQCHIPIYLPPVHPRTGTYYMSVDSWVNPGGYEISWYKTLKPLPENVAVPATLSPQIIFKAGDVAPVTSSPGIFVSAITLAGAPHIHAVAERMIGKEAYAVYAPSVTRALYLITHLVPQSH